ncbi:pyrroline-5-carboxylate reductase [Facklamia sp. 7083-14-GEN3]|uniref:pyrroline-5-carboxylate reductase n=1 Tax=Facklamia sp. 7083-14-GEN3 TaxID=2973478 RepID=UPI00215CE993|nr:pyrroline-5-carboxylate reductase [Facklamia sp. 7083-14-GEN3]MCR8968827.1 pyrroline-5-carboxylate reductase [Facklamia sp. 7083-14-GEN3]
MTDFTIFKAIGFIGCGNMGSAIIKTLSAAFPDLPIYLYDIDKNKSQNLAESCGNSVEAVNSLEELLNAAQSLFIGVKPKDLNTLLDSINSIESIDYKLWISMVVGRTLNSIQQLLPQGDHLIRIMPNTPVAIGQGYVSYCYQEETFKGQTINEFKNLLQPLGHLQLIEESLFDVASAIAGSGPAFVYQLIEAISDAGVYYGLNRQLAINMAAKTVAGAGQMVLESQEHPAQLKDAVTSPKGTTIAGVRSLEASNFRSAIIEAVSATIERT